MPCQHPHNTVHSRTFDDWIVAGTRLENVPSCHHSALSYCFSVWIENTLPKLTTNFASISGDLQVFHSNDKFGTEKPRHETLMAVSRGVTQKQRTHNWEKLTGRA